MCKKVLDSQVGFLRVELNIHVKSIEDILDSTVQQRAKKSPPRPSFSQRLSSQALK